MRNLFQVVNLIRFSLLEKSILINSFQSINDV